MSKRPNISGLGSPRPLNWQGTELAEPVVKSETHAERGARYHRFGTPVTRSGMAHGVQPMTPPMAPANTPPLVVKAVRRPPKPGEGGTQFARKRDPSGKFAPQQQAGEESTAAEDVAEEKRRAQLASARMHEKMRMMRPEHAYGARKGLDAAPGISSADQSLAQPVGQEGVVMGQTITGKPIYDDPYHPQHTNFTDAEHEEAADAHRQQADIAATTGDQQGSLRHAQQAEAHRMLAQDAQSPMDRAMGPGVDTDMGKAMDALAKFAQGPIDKDPKADQNKPDMSDDGDRDGPKPRMEDSRTGDAEGPQTSQEGHAGTTPAPSPTPGPGGYPPDNSSLPSDNAPGGLPGEAEAQAPGPGSNDLDLSQLFNEQPIDDLFMDDTANAVDDMGNPIQPPMAGMPGQPDMGMMAPPPMGAPPAMDTMAASPPVGQPPMDPMAGPMPPPIQPGFLDQPGMPGAVAPMGTQAPPMGSPVPPPPAPLPPLGPADAAMGGGPLAPPGSVQQPPAVNAPPAGSAGEQAAGPPGQAPMQEGANGPVNPPPPGPPAPPAKRSEDMFRSLGLIK